MSTVCQIDYLIVIPRVYKQGFTKLEATKLHTAKKPRTYRRMAHEHVNQIEKRECLNILSKKRKKTHKHTQRTLIQTQE